VKHLEHAGISRHYHPAPPPRRVFWQLKAPVFDQMRAGILVMFDMHTISSPEHNDGAWCDFANSTHCAPDSEDLVFSAWRKLAKRYCSSPNVRGRD
jgi:hypothetical protein